MTLTEKQAIGLIAYLQDLYPSANFSTTAPQSWALLLHEFDWDQIQRALPDFCKAHISFPTAPALLAFLKTGVNGPQLSFQEAWDVVLGAIKAHGCENAASCRDYIRRTLPPDQATIAITAAKRIGWVRIGTTEYKDHGTLLAQFRDAVQAATLSAQQESWRMNILGTGSNTAIEGGDDE